MDPGFETVTDVSEPEPGRTKRIAPRGRPLLLVNAENECFVIDEMCSHEGYPLHNGCIGGKTIKCSLHGGCFDLATGAPLEEPATEPLRTCKVRIERGKVRVRL